MKVTLLILIFSCFLLMFCSQQTINRAPGGNPFFSDYNTPFNTPPFDKIKEEHFIPAYTEGMKQEKAEVAAIINNTDPPTFENTIEALEATGELLTKVSYVFGCLNSANTNESLQSISRTVSPLISQHNDDINLNPELFKKVKDVYDKKNNLNLSQEQGKLLEDMYKGFVRGGANLSPEDQTKFREINKELSLLTLKFGENVLKETNAFKMYIDNKDDLSGLPESVIAAAAEAAKEAGENSKWLFTIHKPSMIPFLMYSEKRDLRGKIFKAYINQGNNNNELDNKKMLSRVAALRVNRANLLGYKTHADFILERNMAVKPENVYKLLDQLWKPALAVAKKEAKELQSMIKKDGKSFKLKPWDWWYYAEKLRKEKYDLDDEVLRPYFELENVKKGAFEVAEKLFGLKFEKRTDIPKYHKDVDVLEVKDARGTHVGILYVDYFPRASKRGGAWMNNLRDQSKEGGKDIRPLIYNCGNFSKPTADKPSLLSFDEVATLYHEFGHALHGLLADTKYSSLSGTSVARDFVELPSQIMENWASEPEVLKSYAKHYETGEPIPQELIDKLKKSSHFNQGFITVEYLAASFLDMDWHTLKEAEELDALDFENKSMKKIGLIPEIVVRYKSPYFRHVFSGGYSSGYYSYIWAEVLDADAFNAFKETSLFDKKTADSFRKNILEKGGTDDPMTMYKRFRGAEPKIDAILKKRGLN